MRRINFLNTKSILSLAMIATVFLLSQCQQPASLNALIVTDADQESSAALQTILENSGLFDADINSGGNPSFSNYDVVVLSINKGDWSDETKADFESYVNNGGGVVLLGNSAMAFSAWDAFQQIAGVKNEGNSTKSNTSYVYSVKHVETDHPVTKGLHSNWIHEKDFLLYSTSDLTDDADIIATVKADTVYGGNGRFMPVIFVNQFGQGRVFHSTLGNDGETSTQCVGFITTLQRGAEWAATGVVSQDVPLDFPNIASTHSWAGYEPLDLDEILKRASNYEVGKSKKYLTDFSMRLRNCDGSSASYAQFEDKMIDFLASDASIDSKKFICRELSWMGSEKSIAALEKLVNDKDLSEHASYALQRLRM